MIASNDPPRVTSSSIAVLTTPAFVVWLRSHAISEEPIKNDDGKSVIHPKIKSRIAEKSKISNSEINVWKVHFFLAFSLEGKIYADIWDM